MAKTTDLPARITDAGLDFNYATWSPGTSLWLGNVPWDSDYKDIVNFADKQAFIDYIKSLPGEPLTITAATYAKPFQPIIVPASFNTVAKYNYVLVYNPKFSHLPDDTAYHFGYFISNPDYVNPGATRINIQCDYWQTFGYSMTWGRAFLERGHLLHAASHTAAANNELDSFIKGYLTVPEGLDVGGDYVAGTITKTYLHGGTQPDFEKYGVVIVSTVDMSNSGGTVDAPVLESAGGAIYGLLPSGCDLLYFSLNDYAALMNALQAMPWVSQGIISATIIPEIDADGFAPITIAGVSGHRLNYGPDQHDKEIDTANNWRGKIVSSLSDFSEPWHKMRTYPYSYLELTLFNGKPLILKPELIPASNSNLTVVMALQAAPPGQRMMIFVRGYGAVSQSSTSLEAGLMYDYATGWTDMPQLSVVNDGYMSYMANNRNSLAFQKSSADWSQQRALQGAATAYDVTTGAIGAADASNSSANSFSAMQAAQQANFAADMATSDAVWGVGKGAAYGLMGGGNPITGALGGAVGGAIEGAHGIYNTGKNNEFALQQNARAVGQANQQRSISRGQEVLLRDANIDLAKFAARGDYENTIAGINARVRDAELTPPSVAGQTGGDGFLLNQALGYAIYVSPRRLNFNAERAIVHFWRRYGYAGNVYIDRLLTEGRNGLNVMTKFSYWKLKELYLRNTNCPDSVRLAVRGIFEKGVTVWTNPADIGVTSWSGNEPIAGVSV